MDPSFAAGPGASIKTAILLILNAVQVFTALAVAIWGRKQPRSGYNGVA